MSYWNQLRTSRKEAKLLFNKPEWQENPYGECPDGDYAVFRNDMKKAWSDVKEKFQESDSRYSYLRDVAFSIKLYERLSNDGFGIWEASDDDIWRFMSLKVLPDMVKERWAGWREEYFYSKKWGIWFKVLWWYVFLTMQQDGAGKFDGERTFEVLKDNTSDMPIQLFSRFGKGFRPEFTRKLFARFQSHCSANGIKGTDKESLFRRLMKQYTMTSLTIEPEVMGVDAYIDYLFRVTQSN